MQYPALGNNTSADFETDGSPNSDGSGAASGGNWKKSKLDVQKLIEEVTPDLTEIEAQMGKGGSIKLVAAKHILLEAGTTPANYDSGIIIKDAIPVDGEYTINGDKSHVLNKIAVPNFQEKDTSSALPFGDFAVKANGKLMLEAGSGGVDLNTSGNVKLTTAGRLLLGGADVTIGGGTSNNAGTVRINVDSDVFIESGNIITTSAPTIKTNATSQYSIKSPQTFIEGNVHIAGDLYVTGEIIAGGDIIAGGPGGVSLLKHTHGGVKRDTSSTLKPN
jgi:phage baseplate assembly protein gpV